MIKPIVFISHITEEKHVALALKSILEDAFIGLMDVFISSDPRSIQLGQEWLDKIKFALNNCAVEIIIASPRSVTRPWVNFEAGSGWIRNVPVIPLCHSGMTPEKLPLPLKTFQGATATKEDEINLILPVLAKALNSSVPRTNFSHFVEKVLEFESDSRDNLSVIRPQQPANDDGEALLPHELATFLAVAELCDIDTPVSISNIKLEVQQHYRPVAVNLALKMLERKDLVILSIEKYEGYNATEEFLAVRISDPGWIWLQANQSKLDLSQNKPKRSDDFDDPF
jgi:hypothetical protein